MTATIGTVLLAHGSAREEQRPVIEQLARDIAEADGDAFVGTEAAFLDHHDPTLDQALTALARKGATEIIVVPALLSSAFHARHDVPRAVRNAASRASVEITIADPFGLDDRLGPVVDARALSTGIADIDTVVVASAGTGVGSAREDFRRAVRQWRGRHPWRLNAAFIAGGDPEAVEMVTTLVDQNQRVVVVPFLLGDGQLQRKLTAGALEAGALAVSDVLGADPALIAIARDRRDACATVA